MRLARAFAITAILASATGPALANPNFDYMKARSTFSMPTLDDVDPSIGRVVALRSTYAPGTIVVKTAERRLYLMTGVDEAIAYDVGVGRPGFDWKGVHTISRMQEGGANNPLGARALYLGETMVRIQGSNAPETIDTAVFSGCLRMRNEDVEDLYRRVKIGTKVVVL